MKINIYDRGTDQTTVVDHGTYMTDGPLQSFKASWSPDSRWLAYGRDLPNTHSAVFVYDYSGKQLHQVTSPFYSTSSPAFDPSGKYLFVATNQSFEPLYSDLDNTFIYPNSTRLAAIVLQKSTPSPLYPKSDTVAIKKEEEKTAAADKKAKPPVVPPASKPSAPEVKIDFDALESRLIILPGEAGNYNNLQAAEGKLLYLQQPNTGSGLKAQALRFYDIDKRKTKTILEDVGAIELAADGKHILVEKDHGYFIVAADEGQKMEKKLRTSEMQQWVTPREEWRQIYTDAWRLERDYFYDAAMHGVDWAKVRTQYGKLVDEASTREEVDFIIGEMIGELNSSHTYHGGGAIEETKRASVGYLGVDWTPEGDYYKIKKIIRGASWDAEVRSPLSQPGVPVKEGDYILAVNGIPLTTKTDVFAPFVNLAGKSVEITYSSSAGWSGAHTVVVQLMPTEFRLRNLAWIEEKRTRVEAATNGQVGYIHVPSTGLDGQNELIRQFTGQLEKKALIIDERFNNGGQIPDRFVEMLNRKPLAFFATRDGAAFQTPPAGNFGAKVMLINGWSGSGGDAFPDYFRKAGLGPLIGTRTGAVLSASAELPVLSTAATSPSPPSGCSTPMAAGSKKDTASTPISSFRKT
ncbi:PDZ domain-containing protein [Puia sp. P3]|uniref:PDZ domain-containing protein n=1 Tax=Puia sp. P3 TaxID=3423952 RepID=UPI003D671BCC